MWHFTDHPASTQTRLSCTVLQTEYYFILCPRDCNFDLDFIICLNLIDGVNPVVKVGLSLLFPMTLT